MGSIKRATAIERVRQRYLADFGDYVMKSISAGQWTGGRLCAVEACNLISGPRAGAIELLVGVEAGKIRQKLAADDCAILRRAITWDFAGDPQAHMHGRYLRLEAGWPGGLSESKIRLSDIPHKPDDGSGWVAGRSETGNTIIPHLNNKTPHFLIAGATGAGKSVALQNAVIQLSAHEENKIVLIDGKLGESLKPLERLPGVVGPCAVDLLEIRNALKWATAEMIDRQRRGVMDGRIILVYDEIQEQADDSVVASLLRRITAQGRSRRVHALVATQHPSVDAFGDKATRRALLGKVALLVDGPDASRVAVSGKSPRADKLLGEGDSFIIGPGQCHRVQGAFVDDSDIARVIKEANGRAGQWQFEQWPEIDPMEIGRDLPKSSGGGGFQAEQWSEHELAAALIGILNNDSRRDFCARATAMGANIGSTRGRNLLRIGHEVAELLNSYGYTITATPSSRAIVAV